MCQILIAVEQDVSTLAIISGFPSPSPIGSDLRVRYCRHLPWFIMGELVADKPPCF